MWGGKVAGLHRLILHRSSTWVEQLVSHLHHTAPRGRPPPPPPAIICVDWLRTLENRKKSVYLALEANPGPSIVTARSLVALPNSLSWLRAY